MATAVPAFAHDNAIIATAACTSPSSGTWSATFKVTNDYGLAEMATAQHPNGGAHLSGAITGVFPIAAGSGSFISKTASGLTSASASESEYGVWTDGFQSGSHSATAYKPADCKPVIHNPQVTASSVCQTATGKYLVTYSLVSAGGSPTTITPGLPATQVVPGSATSASQSFTFTYSDGPDQVRVASTELAGTCTALVLPVVPTLSRAHQCGKTDTVIVPAQPTGIVFAIVKTKTRETVTFTATQGYSIPAPVPTIYTFRLTTRAPCFVPHRAPSARLVGPCGDPYYGAVFNNSRSNVAVTFTWSYVNFYTGHRSSVRVKVGAHHVRDISFRHVLGGTRMTIRTASGRVLARGTAAPSGNYGVCHF